MSTTNKTVIEDTDPVEFIPGFIKNPDDIFEALWNDLAWERRENTPRREYWTNVFGRSYAYGSKFGPKTYESNVTHPAIEEVSAALEAHLGFRYEACFLNGYEDASDYLGPHADDDPKIDHSRPIAIVTVGGAREIEFMEIATKRKVRVMLTPGSLFLMKPGMQSTHLHKIPKAGFVVSKPRISLTFRGLFGE
jgi:alkylated DNA repair dioxygenase AlkB